MSNDSDETESSSGRKGRGNAILSYETLVRIEQKLAAIMEWIEGQKTRWNTTDMKIADHETRVRALETALTSIVASASKGTAVWQWVWVAILSVINLSVSIYSVLRATGH